VTPLSGDRKCFGQFPELGKSIAHLTCQVRLHSADTAKAGVVSDSQPGSEDPRF